MSIRYLLPKVVAAFGLAFPITGFCGGVDVCHTLPVKQGGSLNATNQPLSATEKLDCSQLGKMSLEELKKNGWSVVNVTYVAEHDPYNRTWMVVVEQR